MTAILVLVVCFAAWLLSILLATMYLGVWYGVLVWWGVPIIIGVQLLKGDSR